MRARRAARAAGAGTDERPTRGAAGAGRAAGPGRGAALARAAVWLVVAPLLVYVASYADYFASGHTVRQWLHLQGYMASFNWNVSGTSSMSSRPLTWIFDATPIWYRWQLSPHGVLGLIAIGNPLLFWGAIAAFVWLAWAAVRRRDPNLAAAPALVAVLYLPWLATSRQSYIYYLTPAIPFLAILVAAALSRLAGRGRWAAAGRRSAWPSAPPPWARRRAAPSRCDSRPSRLSRPLRSSVGPATGRRTGGGPRARRRRRARDRAGTRPGCRLKHSCRRRCDRRLDLRRRRRRAGPGLAALRRVAVVVVRLLRPPRLVHSVALGA